MPGAHAAAAAALCLYWAAWLAFLAGQGNLGLCVPPC